MALPYNADTALDPKTWLPGGESVPSSGVSQAAYPGPRVLVSGAGTAEVNGVYVDTGLLVEDRTAYFKNADETSYSVKFAGPSNYWEIQSPGQDPLYNNSPGGEHPWSNNDYSDDGGQLPAPSVTEFPA
jgi:hypothetical protein